MNIFFTQLFFFKENKRLKFIFHINLKKTFLKFKVLNLKLVQTLNIYQEIAQFNICVFYQKVFTLLYFKQM